MLTVSEAIAAITSTVPRLPAVHVPLDGALGLVLAEDVCADLDSPPFDKALMDGYAVRAADLESGAARLQVIEEVLAGQVAKLAVGTGQATRIMTGAPLPVGADAVVPVEQTQMPDDHTVEIAAGTSPVRSGQNILKQGASTKKGQQVLPRGRAVRAQEVGCLAELGRAQVHVYRRPRVAILSTGDELVPVDRVPEPGQIRNSNEIMLTAQVRQAGAEPVPLGIARDVRSDLCQRISQGLGCEMLLLSGGVSAGKVDLVPAVLADLGVRQVFHKVRVKPGQPLWFGMAGSCAVFGLPGNPVSSMVCCELFARTALRKMLGIEPAEPTAIPARLTAEQRTAGTRPTYHPARLEWTPQGPIVSAVPWVGSADLCATAAANAMALFPEGNATLAAGTIVDVFLW